MRNTLITLALTTSLLTACGQTAADKNSAANLPATLGIIAFSNNNTQYFANKDNYHLALHDNQRFDLQFGAQRDFGHWALSADNKQLILFGHSEAPYRLLAVNHGWQLANNLGEALESSAPLQADAPPVDFAPAAMLGEFVYFADSANFRLCGEEKALPVIMNYDYLNAEQAYLSERSEPMQPVLMQLDGYISAQPPMEGDGFVDHILISKFKRVPPRLVCSPPSELDSGEWHWVDVGGRAVSEDDFSSPATLKFSRHDEQWQVSGSDGCNGIWAEYAEGKGFSLGPSTLMACPEMERNDAVREALNQSTDLKLGIGTLDLFNQDVYLGRLVLR